MLRDLQIIYQFLYEDLSHYNSTFIKVQSIINFCAKHSTDNPQSIWQDLLTQVLSLKKTEIDPAFIERFCLSRIADVVLEQYPINVAEAFAIACVLLMQPMTLDLLHFKLGSSRLLCPTLIRGTRVEDVEAISDFVVFNLTEAQLLKVTDNRYVCTGEKLSLDL